jgi:hypothetical protein
MILNPAVDRILNLTSLLARTGAGSESRLMDYLD